MRIWQKDEDPGGLLWQQGAAHSGGADHAQCAGAVVAVSGQGINLGRLRYRIVAVKSVGYILKRDEQEICFGH